MPNDGSTNSLWQADAIDKPGQSGNWKIKHVLVLAVDDPSDAAGLSNATVSIDSTVCG